MIKSGVYALMHVPTGAAYIGSAVNMMNRFTHHRFMLRNNEHANTRLQELWGRTQERDWVFVYLPAPAEARKLHKQEQHWMENWPGEVLNMQPLAGTPKGHKLSEKTKQKQSEAAKRVAADPAEKKRRSERAKRQHKEGKLGKRVRLGEGRPKQRYDGA